MKNLIKQIKNSRCVEAHIIKDLSSAIKTRMNFGYEYDFFFLDNLCKLEDDSFIRYDVLRKEVVIMQVYENYLIDKFNIEPEEIYKIVKNSEEIIDIIGEIDIIL